MKIEDSKLVYPEFKYFKNIYTKINLAEEIFFEGNENDVDLYFNTESSFAILYGKIEKQETEFLKWLKDKTVKFKMADIIQIGKCLKKNAVSIEYDDTNFIFNFTDKDGVEIKVSLENSQYEKLKEIKRKIQLVKQYDIKSGKIDLEKEDFQSDIFVIYNEEEKVSRKRTSDKIIEIPKERINSLLKDFTNVNIQYSTKDNIGARYVILSSKNDEFNLELSEMYKTI